MSGSRSAPQGAHVLGDDGAPDGGSAQAPANGAGVSGWMAIAEGTAKALGAALAALRWPSLAMALVPVVPILGLGVCAVHAQQRSRAGGRGRTAGGCRSGGGVVRGAQTGLLARRTGAGCAGSGVSGTVVDRCGERRRLECDAHGGGPWRGAGGSGGARRMVAARAPCPLGPSSGGRRASQ